MDFNFHQLEKTQPSQSEEVKAKGGIEVNAKPSLLPVFHHIAKNAGTYVLSWAQMFCRQYHISLKHNELEHWTSAKIRRALIPLKYKRQLTVIYCTLTDLTGDEYGVLSFDKSKDTTIFEKQMNFINSKYPQGLDSSTNIIESLDFIKLVQTKDILPFCVIIDPMEEGWKDAQDVINNIVNYSERESALHFTVLRDPFKRALSMFNYLKSEDSSHEPTHGSLISSDFSEYLQSDEVEDSWFLRSVINLPRNAIIEPFHMTLADQWLRHFRISDISKVDGLINNVFHGAYGVLQDHVPLDIIEQHLDRNETSNKLKISFNDLDKKVAQKFLDRTYWDRKLWERYCKNVDIS